MERQAVALLHYTAPPVTGGVESVILAHARLLVQEGFPVRVIAGRGDASALPAGVDYIEIPEMDSKHASTGELRPSLDKGEVPAGFEELTGLLYRSLEPVVRSIPHVIIHNVLTKHFNLPLTAALFRLLDDGALQGCIAWCHDLTWTSPHSRVKVYPRYPWDLLRTYREEICYVAVSEGRKEEMNGLFQVPADKIQVIYNGVDPKILFGLSAEGQALIHRLKLWDCDLILLMPVRVTQAKNVEFALKLLAALHKVGVKAKGVLTGPPDPHVWESQQYFEQLLRLRAELGLQDWMHFVYESGPDPQQPYRVDLDLVGELYRLCDLVLMTSHREGFGLPVVEAGLLGTPVATTAVPAAKEIGGEDVFFLDEHGDAGQEAQRLLAWLDGQPVARFRRRIRGQFLWETILERQILPLLR